VSDYIEFTEKNLRDHTRRIAADLRKLADRIEREADSKHPESLASTVQHEFIWGVANVHLDGLTVKQVDYIRARAEEAKP
jgi:hypothetical protein